MIEKFSRYFDALVIPWNSYNKEADLSLADSILISWVFSIINGVIKIILINLLLILIYSLIEDHLNIFPNGEQVGYYFLIFSMTIDIVFFPLFLLFMVQFWSYVLNSLSNYVAPLSHKEQKVDRVIKHSLSSNVFLTIPVFGTLLRYILAAVLMFIGMKKELKFSNALAICALLAPIFIAMCLIMLLSIPVIIANL